MNEIAIEVFRIEEETGYVVCREDNIDQQQWWWRIVDEPSGELITEDRGMGNQSLFADVKKHVIKLMIEAHEPSVLIRTEGDDDEDIPF